MSSVRVFWPRFDQSSLLDTLKEQVQTLSKSLPLRRVVLFGSWARGNYTAASDVDLMVIYQGEPRQDAYALVTDTLRLPSLEPHVYAETEYLSNKNVLDRMTAGGKVIFEGRGSHAGPD